MLTKKIILLLVVLLTIVNLCFSQNSGDTSLVHVETKDGNEYVGKIVQEDEQIIILTTNNLGNITIQRTDIKSLQPIQQQQIKDGEFWFPNMQSSRYFWAPNGYGLHKDEGYYQNIYVFWNQFSYGFTDNFSMGFGIIPLFLFAGAATPIFITPKFSIPVKKDKFNLGAGALVGTIIGEDIGMYGLLYGLSTIGTTDNNVSVGLAYGFADGDLAKSPVLNVSGLFRLSNKGYFITENYFLNIDEEGGALLGLGGRWIIKKAALDFLFVIPVAKDMGGFIAFPLIGFSIPFQNKN